MLSLSYCNIWFVIILLQSLVCRQLVMTWCFSLSRFDALFAWRVIQTGKAASISRIYQIMVINMLKTGVIDILVTILSNL